MNYINHSAARRVHNTDKFRSRNWRKREREREKERERKGKRKSRKREIKKKQNSFFCLRDRANRKLLEKESFALLKASFALLSLHLLSLCLQLWGTIGQGQFRPRSLSLNLWIISCYFSSYPGWSEAISQAICDAGTAFMSSGPWEKLASKPLVVAGPTILREADAEMRAKL